GINSRLDTIQAAILKAKLPYLKSWTNARRNIAARYDELFKGLENVITPQAASDRTHVYHLYVIRTERRDALRQHLSNSGIMTLLHYPKALPFLPAYVYLGHQAQDFPVAYANQSRILSLPIYPELSETMIAYVAEKITEFLLKSEVAVTL